MSETPFIAMLKRVHEDLASYAAGLSHDQLVHESACAGWDVAQVLGHLGSATEGMKATLDAAAAGGDMPGPELQQSIWDRANAMGPEEKRDSFLQRSAALVDTFDSLDPALQVELRFSPVPLSPDQVASFLVLEMALHAWDVRVPFDSDAHLFAPALPMLMELVSRLMGMRASGAALTGEPVVAVELVEPEQSFGLRFGEKVERVDLPANPDAVVRGDTEDWLLLLSGRSGGPLDVSGALGVEDLQKVFAGF